MPKKGESTELKTACPSDVRYPNANATKFCFQMFIDYQRCTRLLGKTHVPCDYFKNCYKTICPLIWIAKWTEQIETDCFPVDLPKQEETKKK